LKQAAQSGFVCAHITLNSDPWLSPLRKHPEFGSVLNEAETLVTQAQSTFEAYTANSQSWRP